MIIRNLSTRAAHAVEGGLFRLRTNRSLQRTALFAVALVASNILSAGAGNTGAQAMADGLRTNIMPYIILGFRLFGLAIAVGGFVVGFNGLTGREEGFEKVFKLFLGFLGIGLGIFCIVGTPTIITWLNVENAFTTT